MHQAMTNVLAIDPGERTGWARANISDDGEWADIRQGVNSVRDFLLCLEKHYGEYDIVIYETWRLFPHKARSLVGSEMTASQVIGGIRLISWHHPKTRLLDQGPNTKSTAMKTMPSHLKDRMAKSSEQHDQDALMHLWYWTWKNT